MDFLVQKRTMELLYRLLTQKNEEAARIPYTPGKTLWPEDLPESSRLERSTPEAQGVSSEYLKDFFETLQAHPEARVHSVMVLRHGKVIAEGSFAPYRPELWHVTHSLCKSMTGMAVGMLIDEGKLSLDDRIIKIFSDQAGPLALLRQMNLTVRQLLTMTSGVVFNEAGAVTEEHWIKSFLESNVRGVPGETFQYNSMNSYMLAAVVCRVSGRSLSDYLKDKLWEPLGIRRIYWETSPEGIEKGGWGLYMTIEDMAKLGQLMLQKGCWEGRRILSEEWVSQSTAKQIETPPEMTPYGYGYQIWMGQEPGSFQFNGMLGQNVMVFPRTDTVIVNTAGNMELDARCQLAEWIEEYFGKNFAPSEEPLSENTAAWGQLRTLTEHLGSPLKGTAALCRRRVLASQKHAPKKCGVKILADGLGALCGHSFSSQDASVALLPLFMQAVQNNYSPGIRRLHFDFEDGSLYVTIFSGAEQYRLKVGFHRACEQKIYIRGEAFQTAVQGHFTYSEDDIAVLKLRICFLEFANERHIKVFLQPGGIKTYWSETPGEEMIMEALDVVAGTGSGLMNTLLSRMDPGFFVYKLHKTLRPEAFFEKES